MNEKLRNAFRSFWVIFSRELVILWLFGLALSFALIILSNKGKLPLGKGDFVFFSIITLLSALYRPRWAFFIFIILIPLENIILASGFLPFQLRPYQFMGAVIILALIILYIFKRLNFKILKPIWLDWLVFSLAPLGFLASVNAPNKAFALRQALILLSFVVLYYLIRVFLRTKEDLIKAGFFFLGSLIVVVGYGFYQVLVDKFGGQSFEVMFGRPNAAFAEPDWLGIFLCFALTVLLTAIFYLNRIPPLEKGEKFSLLVILYALVFLTITLLILTLARSAWVGATAVIIFYLFFSLYRKTKSGIAWETKKFVGQFIVIALLFAVSLGVIHFGELSKFDVLDRFRSAATSEQKITIACEKNSRIPESITSAEKLENYNCRHINLEEIESYKSQGKIVTQVYRKDPNVKTRSEIYRESFKVIKEHPVLGIGYGSVTERLGADERGAGLNESNIFLQVWSGSGILGLIVFTAVIIYLFTASFRKLSPFCKFCPLSGWLNCSTVEGELDKTVSIFVILGIIALVIPNLFNAGLLMGLFWLGMAWMLSVICLRVKGEA